MNGIKRTNFATLQEEVTRVPGPSSFLGRLSSRAGAPARPRDATYAHPRRRPLRASRPAEDPPRPYGGAPAQPRCRRPPCGAGVAVVRTAEAIDVSVGSD